MCAGGENGGDLPAVRGRQDEDLPAIPARQQKDLPAIPARQQEDVPAIPGRQDHVPAVRSRQTERNPNIKHTEGVSPSITGRLLVTGDQPNRRIQLSQERKDDYKLVPPSLVSNFDALKNRRNTFKGDMALYNVGSNNEVEQMRNGQNVLKEDITIDKVMVETKHSEQTVFREENTLENIDIDMTDGIKTKQTVIDEDIPLEKVVNVKIANVGSWKNVSPNIMKATNLINKSINMLPDVVPEDFNSKKTGNDENIKASLVNKSDGFPVTPNSGRIMKDNSDDDDLMTANGMENITERDFGNDIVRHPDKGDAIEGNSNLGNNIVGHSDNGNTIEVNSKLGNNIINHPDNGNTIEGNSNFGNDIVRHPDNENTIEVISNLGKDSYGNSDFGNNNDDIHNLGINNDATVDDAQIELKLSSTKHSLANSEKQSLVNSEKQSMVNSEKQTIFLINSLGRGGSTWLAEILSTFDAQPLYFFEPLAILQHTNATINETSIMSVMEDVHTCKFDYNQPALNKFFFKDIYFRYCKKQECIQKEALTKRCLESRFHLSKVGYLDICIYYVM